MEPQITQADLGALQSSQLQAMVRITHAGVGPSLLSCNADGILSSRQNGVPWLLYFTAVDERIVFPLIAAVAQQELSVLYAWYTVPGQVQRPGTSHKAVQLMRPPILVQDGSS